MRIIAGEFSGRLLVSPPSDKTRPITDRAKQSLFDALAVTVDLTQATVLDCFSGTGSMGLEAISRGAAKCFFVERDRGALGALKQNIKDLGVSDKCVVLPVDAYRVGSTPVFATEKLRVAFVDPPYAHVATGFERHKVDALVTALALGCMESEGIISLRHPSNVSVDAEAMGVRVVREMRYGDMGITWVSRVDGAPNA